MYAHVSIISKQVPRTTYCYGVKNSFRYTKPTVTLPLVIAPAMNIIIKVRLSERLKNNTTRHIVVVIVHPVMIQRRPTLSAINGIIKIVIVHPTKKRPPIRPILSFDSQTKSSCSTQLWILVSLE